MRFLDGQARRRRSLSIMHHASSFARSSTRFSARCRTHHVGAVCGTATQSASHGVDGRPMHRSARRTQTRSSALRRPPEPVLLNQHHAAIASQRRDVRAAETRSTPEMTHSQVCQGLTYFSNRAAVVELDLSPISTLDWANFYVPRSLPMLTGAPFTSWRHRRDSSDAV